MGKADCQAACSPRSCLTSRRRSATFSADTWRGISLSPISDSSTRISAVEQNAGTSCAVIFLASSLKSRVSSSAGPVSRSRMSRIRAGSTNRSADGIGICMITKAATSLDPVCIGLAVTTASALSPPARAMVSTAFPSRSDRTASSSMFIEMSVSRSEGLAVMSLR